MKTIIDIKNTDGILEATSANFKSLEFAPGAHPGDGYEYTLAFVRTGITEPFVTATVDYSACDGTCDYPHGFIEFEFIAAGETINIVEAIAVDSRTNSPCEGTAWLALDNTEEYEPETLRRLTELYGHESEVLEAMRDALAAVEDTLFWGQETYTRKVQ